MDNNLSVLARRLQQGHYGPSQLKAVFIPKPNSDKERMICIPTVCDRLVQRAIITYLEKNQKLPIYNSSSFGFLRDLGTDAAIKAAVGYRQSYDWCLKTDIESFFDRIPRQYLKARVGKALGKHSLVPIVSKIIDCEVKPTIWNRAKISRHGIQKGLGIRQGMPLSPILANLVLSEFDSRMEHLGMKMVRYADDIAAFFETKEEAQKGHKIISETLARISLSIPGISDVSKTQLLGPDDPIDFLGREIVRVGTDKQAVWRVAKKQIRKIVRKLEEEYTIHARMKADSNFQETVIDVWDSISAYFTIYKGAYNFVSLDSALRETSRKIIGDIFLDLFGEQALSRLTSEQRKFLGMSHVDFDEANSDIMA
ncbi:reverse transcriptase domain-containing protein [Bradyrhizobium guangdongense]|uniref:reverse transcriptase domain-containing protein n=1 Tax=Bradyrhizobium guangdongense TaxID=1325090 RepID=UPI00131A1D59|nr:reverse transcriptase domain-containing protein [Bradyrhizobium guangdongense]